MADNETLARALYEAWNNRDWQATMDAVAPGGTITVMGTGDTFEGADGALKFNMMWADAFPDGRITVDHVYGAGDSVVVEFTGHGTHTGPLNTSMGSIPATGRSVTLHLCDVWALITWPWNRPATSEPDSRGTWSTADGQVRAL